jgi:methionyl-tRNA synthetase
LVGGQGEGAAAKQGAKQGAPAPQEPIAPRISITDFAKVDLRVAEILAAEKLPKSRKLLKLTVRVGEESRTVVAGIAEAYAPETLVGRKIVVVANLEPATLMGVESNGMVLAGSGDGTLALLAPDKDLPPGARVK